MTLITRRRLLENAAKGGLAVGAGGLIAACGSSGSSSSTAATTGSSTAAAGTPKHGGTLRAGLTGGSSSDTADPNTIVNNTDYARAALLYESLVWLNADAQQYNRLAEEMTPNKDATVWTIRLRSGVTFHNGKDVTADDLIFSINRVINPKSPGEAANALSGINAAGMKKLDNLTISVPFAKPYSTFPESLANNITVYVLPVGFDPKNPIGTGPFKMCQFTPGQQTVLTRFENYWNAPLPYLNEIIMTDYSDETSQVNALLSGQVDVVNLLSQDTIGTVTGSGKKVVISDGGGWNPFTMRVDQAPFTDVRVRQAFRLAVDREAMLKTVFGGHGTLGNDIFGIWAPEYDHSIPQRAYDPEQAKSLLKAAGQENLAITLVTGDIAQGVINMAQVYAQQAAPAGINAKLQAGHGHRLLRAELPEVGLRPGLLVLLAVLPAGQPGHPAGLAVQRDSLQQPEVHQPVQPGAGDARRGHAAGDRARDADDRLQRGWLHHPVLPGRDRWFRAERQRDPAVEDGFLVQQLGLRARMAVMSGVGEP